MSLPLNLRKLSLTQFRSYDMLIQEFEPGINCLLGPNGAGKTNILDALHFLAFTKGFRNVQDKQAIKEGNTFFLVEGAFSIGNRQQRIQCNYLKDGGKRIISDNEPLKKMSDHIGTLPMVAILPEDTELITGASVMRRKFIDMLISQYSRDYLMHLILYEKILAQRNALLKLIAEGGAYGRDQLSLWNHQLIPHGIYIYAARAAYTRLFQPLLKEYFAIITESREEPIIEYLSQVKENDEKSWWSMLEEKEAQDIQQRFSGAGIHRDDWNMLINDSSVRNFGSQGQKKTFVIALKLAQYHLLEAETNVRPLLLLDDIFDKLDGRRLRWVAGILHERIQGQVFVTDTSYERLLDSFSQGKSMPVHYFAVQNNTINPIRDADQ